MAYVKLKHEVVMRVPFFDAGAKACWLWSCSLMHSNRHSRDDGCFAQSDIRNFYPWKDSALLTKRLLHVGLWEKSSAVFQISNWELFRGPLKERQEWSTIAYEAAYLRDGNACRYCANQEDLQIDHITPRCQGGGDELDNLAVACRRCNTRKGGRTPAQAGMVLL